MTRFPRLHWIAPALLLLTCATVVATDLDEIAQATVSVTCRTSQGRFLGTGVVVHEAGYVLTSTTVVPPKAHDIRVSFLSKRNIPGRIVITDEKLELAVLKVDSLPKNLKAVPVRRTHDVRVGDTVFSYGDAFGAFRTSGKFTASLGIISGKYELKRIIAPQKAYMGRVFETTATMASGMDGGPLLDVSGRLIGLLSLNLSDARWLGVAIPIDTLIEKMTTAIQEHARINLVSPGKTLQLTFVEGMGKSLFPKREYDDKAFRRAMNKVAESVVAIEVNRTAEKKPSTRPGRRPRPRPRPRPRRRGPNPYAAILKRPKTPVTGLIISGNGEILTSFFNVWGTLKSIHVILPDGRRLPAKLLGTDEYRDLAMLKIDAKNLKAVKPVKVPLKVGTRVATIGRSPDPTAVTLTRGVISATGRIGETAVQIDAKANYGNAGGPIVNIDGRVVGLVTHVKPGATWSQNSGVGFATTAEAIQKVLVKLRAGKNIAKPKRGYLGIRMSSGSEAVKGVKIESVQPKSAAADAELKKNDVITHLNGKAVAEAADLAKIILKMKPGEKIVLTILRGKEVLKIDVVLGEHPFL